MKPLPDLNDSEAMVARGRRSALMQARKEALEALRDEITFLNSVDLSELSGGHLHEIAERLNDISAAWGQQ